jgi:hypothetical protein
MQAPDSGIIDFKRVRTTQVRGDSGGRIDNEGARRRPDRGVQSASRQFQSVFRLMSSH